MRKGSSPKLAAADRRGRKEATTTIMAATILVLKARVGPVGLRAAAGSAWRWCLRPARARRPDVAVAPREPETKPFPEPVRDFGAFAAQDYSQPRGPGR